MADLNDHSKRAHALLSASSAHRWLECPPSAAAAAAYENKETEFSREGTVAHEVAEATARGKHTEVAGEITAEMIDYAEGYADYISGLKQTESALVLLETRVDFSPWVPHGFGTADCIVIQDKTMDVIDYKYGKGVQVSADHNPQELLYGLGALNNYGFAYDIEIVRLHIYQPRLNNISVFELTASELLAWGDSIKDTAEKAAAGKGKYKAGAWCKFCPHAGKCRALTKTCTEYVEAHNFRAKIEKLAPHEVAEVLSMEPLVSLWLKRIREAALTDLLNGEDIPGFKAVAGRGSRNWENEAEIFLALQTAGYDQTEITKTELLSVAAMEKALGKKKVTELVGDKIITQQGAPTIAPESDKRPVYDPLIEAKKDFE